MKKLLALVAAGSAMAFLGSAWAQAPGGAAAWLTSADANKDGKVSMAELQASRLAEFDQLDKNKDGFLTADELGPRAARAMHMDANKDGKLSKAEFTNMAPIFDHLDKNKDGFIDQSEMAAVHMR